MNTKVFKAAAVGMAAAAVIGCAALGAPKPAQADTERSTRALRAFATYEACVIRATETGACVIPGRTNQLTVDSGQLTVDEPLSSASPTLSPEGTAREIVRTAELYTEVTPVAGILPNVENCVQSVRAYTDEELELLACCIYCEAGGDEASDDVRRMVGEVVLNRVADPRFPDTIAGILTQKSQYGKFHWTGVVWPARAAYEPEAVERAYRCAELVFTAERLLPEGTIFQAEFIQGEVVASAPGFYFCR